MRDWYWLIIANIPCICFMILTGWFAYLDNGYWGWPFIAALCTGYGIKSSEDKRKEAIERAEAVKKYGYDIFNK